MGYLLVFIGGGIGAALRHGINRAALASFGPGFPLGTLIVNVLGSFLLGALAIFFLSKNVSDQSIRLFLTTGILGGFTTFSAFSIEAALMWQRGDWQSLAVYVLGSVFLSVSAIFGGMALGRTLF
jgi:fluoride exporter